MTCRDLLQLLNSKLETDAELDGSECKMTGIYEHNGGYVARLICPIEGEIDVIEIKLRKLARWEGLKITNAEHLVP